jgi:hypothetical protein
MKGLFCIDNVFIGTIAVTKLKGHKKKVFNHCMPEDGHCLHLERPKLELCIYDLPLAIGKVRVSPYLQKSLIIIRLGRLL